MAAAFRLISLWAALRFLHQAKVGAINVYSLAFVLAILSNEVGFLVLPLTLLLLLWKPGAGKRGVSLLVAGFGVVAVGLLGRRALGIHPSWMAMHAGSAVEFWRYMGWMIAPVHMSVERSTSVPGRSPGAGVLAWIGLIVLIAAIGRMRRRVPGASLGLAWMMLCLLPFCGGVFIYQGMAARFTYLASMGLALAVAAGVLATPRPARGGVLLLVGVWVLWGMWRGVARVSDWTDPAALYQHSLEANPDRAVLWFNLGYSLKQAGNLAGAEHAFTQAQQLRPDYPRVYASLGDVYLAEGLHQPGRLVSSAGSLG